MLHRDERLLRAYRGGQTWAYEVLYREYAEPVRRFLLSGFTFLSRGRVCRYRGGHVVLDVEAVVQETFARAFAPSTRANYDGLRPFKTYLFSIAKNLVLRELQRKERVAAVDPHTEEVGEALTQRSVEAGLSRACPSPEGSVADEQLGELTRKFIAELGDEETTFFSLRFARGLTQEATAERMGVTRARVKLLEKALRRRFLAQLREHGYFVEYTPRPRWSRQAA